MRVRITRALRGSIDGIQLSRLVEGQVYDVNTSLACYLLSEKVAEPADGESTALPTAETRGQTALPRSMAADRRRVRTQTKQQEHS